MIIHHSHDHGCCDHEVDPTEIIFHKEEDFEAMRHAGRLASQTLDFIEPFVKFGITTEKLDQLCHDFIIQHGAIPAPLGYCGFPKSICTSVNHVVCHGIPSYKKLMECDIINIDVTTIVNGWHGDASRTFPVGKISLRARKLIDVTYEAMMRGIEQVKPGHTLGDIGHAIQSFTERNGFSVIRDFCGHGIGRSFHTSPDVIHFGNPGEGLELKEGMFFTIEPIVVNASHYKVKILADGWTAETKDKSLSAQFEHTIGVTKTGYEIFTLST